MNQTHAFECPSGFTPNHQSFPRTFAFLQLLGHAHHNFSRVQKVHPIPNISLSVQDLFGGENLRFVAHGSESQVKNSTYAELWVFRWDPCAEGRFAVLVSRLCEMANVSHRCVGPTPWRC